MGSLGHRTEDIGLIYMRARYYDPAIGRFISEDPGRNGANWYAYCNDNPVNRVDDTGKWPWEVDAALLIFSWIASPPMAELAMAAIGTLMYSAAVPIGILGEFAGTELLTKPALLGGFLAQAGYRGAVTQFGAALAQGQWVVRGVIYASGPVAIALNALGAIAGALVIFDVMTKALE